jgi:hypothetical protein
MAYCTFVTVNPMHIVNTSFTMLSFICSWPLNFIELGEWRIMSSPAPYAAI